MRKFNSGFRMLRNRQITFIQDLQGRVGLLGGTFDPIHAGHIAMAKAATTAHNLDRVVFIPAAQNPLKRVRPLASAEQRLDMLELALSSQADMRFSDIEIQRGAPSFSIDTVREILAQSPVELLWIFGSDQIPELHLWKEFSAFFELVKMVAVTHGNGQKPLDQILEQANELSLAQKEHLRVNSVNLHYPLSASQIRAQLRAGDFAGVIRHIDPQVLDYIRREGLYQ